MREILLVGLGGFLGSSARYVLSGMVLHASGAARFPYATLTVNTLGCLVMGGLAGLAERFHLMTPGTRLFLLTGVLGGFTTFSAFAYETYFLGREQAWAGAILNTILHVAGCLIAVWLGHRLTVSVG